MTRLEGPIALIAVVMVPAGLREEVDGHGRFGQAKVGALGRGEQGQMHKGGASELL